MNGTIDQILIFILWILSKGENSFIIILDKKTLWSLQWIYNKLIKNCFFGEKVNDCIFRV